MTMRKWLCALLALCLLLTAYPFALMEDADVVSEPVDAPVEVQSVELGVEEAPEEEAPEEEAPVEEETCEEELPEEEPVEEEPVEEEPVEETFFDDDEPGIEEEVLEDETFGEANATAPAVRSAKAKSATIKAGQSVTFTVKTARAAKYLHMYNASRKLVKRWGASGSSRVSGGVRVWTVKYKISKGGKFRYTFKASRDKKKTGKGKAVSVTVLPGVTSAKVAKVKINAAGTAKFTVKTNAGAKYLHQFDANGKQIARWGASKYAKLSSDRKSLIWTVTRKINTSGEKKYTFKASLDKKKTGEGKSVKVTVLSRVESAKVKTATIKAGAKARFTVKTDTGANYLFMYSSSGKQIKKWKKAGNAKLSADKKSLVWTVTYKFGSGGVYTDYFKSSADGTFVGIRKTVKVTVLPKVVKVAASKKSVKKGKKLTFTVTTDANAKYLYMYQGKTRLKSWAASKYSKLSGKKRIWKVQYKFNKAGKKKYTFKAALKNKKPGAGKSVTINVTYNPVKYRALLIGQESFSPVCHRNRGDVNLMKEMLGTVKGPTGGKYAVTTKFDQSKNQVLSAIRSTFSAADSNDVSLFFIATHGDVSCSTWYLPEYAGCLSMLPETGYYEDQLTMGELAGALKSVPGKVIVILESCGSGAAVYSSGDSENSAEELKACAAFDAAVTKAFMEADPGVLVDGEGNAYEMSQIGDVANIGDFRVDNKFYVLTASRYREESYGREDGSSSFNFFTLWLCMGIVTSDDLDADYDHNGTLTLKELFKFVNYCGGRFGNDVQHVQVYPKNSSYKVFKR